MSIEEELSNNIGDNLGRLDLNGFEEFLQRIGFGGSGGNLREFLRGVTAGEFSGGFNDFLNAFLQNLFGGAVSFMPVIISIIIIGFISSFASGISAKFLKKSISEISFYVCYGLIIVILLTQVLWLVGEVRTLMTTLSQFMNVIFPILLTLLAALGGATSATTYQPLMAALSVTIVNIITYVVFPLFVASVIFSIVGNISKDTPLNKFSSFFRDLGSWILKGLFGLFTAVTAIFGVTGAAIDNVSIGALKFAVSSYVPILGGYLSDGFDLVMGSLVLIKNAIGFTAVIVLISLILAPVAQILVFVLSLKLAAAILEPIADPRISTMLSAVAKNMKLLITAVLGVGFMFFALVMLVMMTLNY
jgi:stage III sporulation protein AE